MFTLFRRIRAWNCSDGHLRLAATRTRSAPANRHFLPVARRQYRGAAQSAWYFPGNASDGSLGVRAIKAECGITFAQDEATARFGGMPRNAVATGASTTCCRLPKSDGNSRDRSPSLSGHCGTGRCRIRNTAEGDGDLKRILAMLQVSDQGRFLAVQADHHTAPRRTADDDPAHRNLARVCAISKQKPAELAELYKDLLISVTSFFRDPKTFERWLAICGRQLSNSLSGSKHCACGCRAVPPAKRYTLSRFGCMSSCWSSSFR